MQTKKRAKPVKFGKNKDEKITKAKAEADINSDEAKEIKHIIEEKTHPKEDEDQVPAKSEDEEEKLEKEDEVLSEQEETTEDEPQKISLSEESSEQKEEEMALENTEPTSEILPEELQEKEKSEETNEEKPSVFGSFSNDAVNKEPKKSYVGFYVIVAVVTFLIGIVIIVAISYFLPEGKSNISTKVTPTPVVTNVSPTEEPTPTPEKANLSAYSIRILNGSGTTGEAAKVQTLLDDKGFSVASIGNASTSDYTKTVITAKKKVEQSYLDELIKTLKSEYSVNSVVEDASSSQTADVIVTVGSDTAK